MLSRRQLAAFAAFPMLPAALVQDKKRKEDGETPPVNFPVGEGVDQRSAQILEDMQGAWNLINYEADPDYDQPAPNLRNVQGIMVAIGGFMSLQLYGWWQARGVGLVDEVYQSGTYSYKIDSAGSLETKTVMGSTQAANADFELEQSGTPRLFEVDVRGNELIMKRSDGASFSFSRLSSRRTTQDLFGRRKKLKPVEADGPKKKDPLE